MSSKPENVSFPAKISRRQLLQSGLGAIAVAQLPGLLSTVNAQAEDVMGAQNHRYRVVAGWGALPEGKVLGYTHGVQEDAQGRIFVHNQSADAVMIFDADGRFIKSWGEEFKDGAHGMQMRREGDTEFLYLADYVRHIVVKTTLDGETIWTLGVPAGGLYANEGEYKPTNVAFADNGDFYVADGYGKGFIHQYNSKAELIRSWGGNGGGAEQFNCPHGIWVDKRGAESILRVADRENHRFQNFTLAGEYIGATNADLRRPCHFDARGTDLLVPDLAGRVSIFDGQNQLITHLGDNPNESQRANPGVPVEARVPGRFCSPHGACWDKNGNIYVVEWLKPGRITKLARVI